VNHPLFVEGQIEHGLQEAGYGYWGFSPASNPAGGYREYGVDLMGMDEPGYTSDQERTSTDLGYVTVTGVSCRPPKPVPEAYGDGVVTPHAAFLALPYEHREVLRNLDALRDDLGAYGPGGFYDSVAVVSGTVATRYLALDQAMIMGAVGNYLGDDMIKSYFVDLQVRDALRPLMAMETFSAGVQGKG
jgi:hypothetical protein